jgi:hypothetical protein
MHFKNPQNEARIKEIKKLIFFKQLTVPWGIKKKNIAQRGLDIFKSKSSYYEKNPS